MEAKKIPGVPEQKKGAFHDTESQKNFIVSELAAQQFGILKERFFSINHWKDYCGDLSSEFELYNSQGFPIDRVPEIGDFVRIDIPGPGDPEAKGYDWVEVVMVDNRCYNDELERYLISCRPSEPPGRNRNGNVAHFYSRESSSTFIISRGEDYIKVGVYGRNEIANLSDKGIFAKIRNFLVSLGGFSRLTKIQWKSLTDGLLDF